MKVLFVHDHKFLKYKEEYYSTGGLPGEVLKRYIDVFGNLTIVARCEEIEELNNNLTLSSIEGTNFVFVPNHKSISSYYKVNKVKSILEEEIKNSDYIISRVSSLGNLAVKYAKKYKKPYLVEVVGCSWDSMWNYNYKGKILAPISFFNQKKIVKKAPYVVYVTNNFLQKRYPTQGKSINASNVLINNLDEKILQNRIKKITNYDISKTFIIGTIGAIDVKYKGQETIIKTLGKLKKQGYENIEYQIVGGGKQKYLKSVIDKHNVKEQVKFVGVLPKNLIFEWLDKIDLYAQPSKTEGLPRALIEAMSRGVPAIGTNAGGIPELLDKEFVFNKNSDEIQIINLLKKINKEILIEQAERNFTLSKEYEKNLIDFRRENFLKDFKNQYK